MRNPDGSTYGRTLVVALLAPLLALGCDGQPAVTNPVADGSVSAAPADVHDAPTASQVEVAFAICPSGPGSPGAVRMTGGVIHIRESLAPVDLHGDLEGAGFGLFNLDLVEGLGGPARGDFHFELTELVGDDVEGGFEGRHHGHVGDTGFSGRAAGHGFGDLEGLKIRYEFTGRPPPNGFAVSGIVTDPSGSLPASGGSPEAPDCPRAGG